MLVHQILKSKAAADVVTVKPGTSVSDAARVLSEKRIGTVLVSADNKAVLGILSERDIVRELSRRGPGCMTELVDEIMTRDLQTCAAGDEGTEILTRMTEGRFRHMPVMQDGELVGLISIGDVVKARLAELAMEKDALEGMIMGF